MKHIPQNMKTKPNFEYATLAITGTRITPTFRWRALGMSSPQFFTKGLVVDKDSAMYRVTGQIAKPGRWLLIPASTESLWVEQRDDTHARVYMPDNGDAWQLPAPNMKDYPSFPTLINITPDGRYIIQPRITERILNGRVVLILNGLTRFRSLKNNITNWRQQEFLYFELYERPGQLRTRIPCEVINRATSNGRYAYRGNIFEFFAPYLSPDGRHCVLATLRLKPTGEAHTQLLVFNR
ncbi:MAG TPA: hypothetical protein VHV83_14305 [Armatimonadota bacterium]|nr:hypothetical protein [Armatimonadota bacterium]